MTNRTKIILGTIIGVWIIWLIHINVQNIKNQNQIQNQNQNEDTYNSMFEEYVYGTNSSDNEISNIIENEIEENLVLETETNEIANNTINEEIVGKEEQESSSENTEIEDRNTAIDLAKQEWAISIDAYDFEAQAQGNGVYVVKVINKISRTEITRYTVNIRTGAVEEAE